MIALGLIILLVLPVVYFVVWAVKIGVLVVVVGALLFWAGRLSRRR